MSCQSIEYLGSGAWAAKSVTAGLSRKGMAYASYALQQIMKRIY
jgi:hypothetical protein